MSPVNANSGEYKSRIGLDKLYIAEVTQDDANGYTADTPEYLAPAAEASQEPSSSFEIQYADDQPYDVMTAEGETKISLSVTGIPLEMLAKITGKVFDAVSGRMFDDGGTAPYVALSFRSLKSNGKYRYYQYLKGKFDMPKEDTATRAESPEPKTMELIFTAIRTVYEFSLGGSKSDSIKRVIGDEDTTNFSGSAWFSQVQVPSVVAPSALALSSSDPADGASAVVVSKKPKLVFNNALVAGAPAGVMLLKASDASKVTATIALGGANKEITITPSGNLTASTNYIISFAVTDIYGQTLSGAVDFATAA